VLAISADDGREQAITTGGDSGALVLSTPEENLDIVLVYGIVLALYTSKRKCITLTIANSLEKVVRNVRCFCRHACGRPPCGQQMATLISHGKIHQMLADIELTRDRDPLVKLTTTFRLGGHRLNFSEFENPVINANLC